MSQPPAPTPDNTLSYAVPTRISRFARVTFWLSILSALTFFLVLPGLLTLILAAIADDRIKKNSDKLTGRGYTHAASVLGGCAFLFGFFFMLTTASIGKPRELSNRSSCAANLRGIMNSVVIYAAQNSDQFPIVTYAPYSPALNSPTVAAISTSADATLNAYYASPYPQAGSVTANLWLLTLQGLSPKLFMCKSDFVSAGPAPILDASNRFYNNFKSDGLLSYSFAYPWKSDGTVGKWWSNTSDASLPLAADMAPQQGTGKPACVLNPATAPISSKTWSSGNHQRDGQNVAFADVHVDYVKRANVGQSNDNIWTTSANPSTGPAEFGGVPATKSPPNLTSDGPEFDIIMYPIRNLDTGHM